MANNLCFFIFVVGEKQEFKVCPLGHFPEKRVVFHIGFSQLGADFRVPWQVDHSLATERTLNTTGVSGFRQDHVETILLPGFIRRAYK